MDKIDRLFDELMSADDELLLDRIKDNGVFEFKDRDGRSILFLLVINGRLRALDAAIKNGADVNIRDKNGWTPLHFAAQSFACNEAELLIRGGASIDEVDKFGNSALWRAVFCSEGRGDFIKLLMKYGADPDLENESGVSPRKLASFIANYDVKRFFTGVLPK